MASGRVVAITGAARGIGFAVAEAVAARGARVAIGDLDSGQAEAAAARLPGAGAAAGHVGLELDVTDADSFRRFLAQAEQRLGPLDVLVNNAGIMLVGPLAELPPRGAAKIVDVNVKGVMTGMQLAIPRMRARGKGHIVNVISSSAWIAPPALSVYAASKHAARGLTDGVRDEVRAAGIRVTGVYPGVVQTDLAMGTGAARGTKMIAPREVGEAIALTLERPRDELFVPRSLGPLLRLYQAAPPRGRRALAKAFGTEALYTGVDPASRSAYERSIAGD